MSGLPAEAEVPRTSVTVRSFNFLCPNPEDSRSKESADEEPRVWRWAKRILARRAAAKGGELHEKARADSSVWEGRRTTRQ
jgi:hypothetical protein